MYVNEDDAYKALLESGIIKPKTLEGLRDLAVIQEELGDHYDVSELRDGKAGLKRIQHHGLSNSRDNLNAILMAIDAEANGPIVSHRPGLAEGMQGPVQETYGDQRLRMAMQRNLSPGGATELAKPGLREGAMKNISPERRLDRAIRYGVKISQGYDPVTGSRLSMGLDGGHIVPHNVNPAVSESDFNINPENQYVNRAQGDRTGAEKIMSLTNSFKKKFGAASKMGAVPVARMAGLWNIGKGFS